MRGLVAVAASVAVGFALLAAPGRAAADRWVRDAEGECRREWTAGSLLRGPTAMLNGVMLPFRSIAGSFTDGPWAVALLPVSVFVGLWEGVAWTATGAFEAVTGGAVSLAPDGATQRLTIAPVTQMPPSRRTLPAYEVDLCEEGV